LGSETPEAAGRSRRIRAVVRTSDVVVDPASPLILMIGGLAASSWTPSPYSSLFSHAVPA